MRPDSRHEKVRGLRRRIFASRQTSDARWFPTHPAAVSSTRRWRDPAPQRRRTATVPLSWSSRFEMYVLIPGRHAFLILHGIAETFGLDAELAQSVQGHQPAVRVEGHDMGEDAPEREGFSRLAQSVDERVIPGGAASDITENTVQLGVGLVEPLQHGLRGALRFGRAVRIHVDSGQRGGPNFFGEDNVFQELPQSFIRLPPGQQLYDCG